MIELSQYNSVIRAIENNDKYRRTRKLLSELDVELLQAGLSQSDYSRVQEVQKISLIAHFKQEDRPDGEPYVSHPIEVTLDVIRKYGLTGRDVLQAALLHDAVEDQPRKLIEILDEDPIDSDSDVEKTALCLINEKLGTRVAEVVQQLTNPDFSKMVADAQRSGDDLSPVDLKNKFYKEHFLKKFESDLEAFLIKLADFSQNALALGNLEEGPKKDKLRKKYGPVILEVIEKLGTISDSSHPLYDKKASLTEELNRAYEENYA